jgi:transcriptional regulator with XRE-family HTH domain
MVRRREDEDETDETQLMTPEQFRTWRKGLGLKQRDAAERLGLKKRMIQYYEKGKRDGKEVVIPKTVRLACAALARGVADFDGVTETVAGPTPAAAEA